MKEKINKELTRLQKELQDLENATSQIKKAESIASQVTNSVKDIQKKYAEHLDALKDETKKNITEHTQQSKRIIDTLNEKQSKLLEESNKQLTDLKKEIEEKGNHNHKKIDDFLSTSLEKNNALFEAHSKQIAEVNKLLEQYLELAESTGKLSQRIENVNFPERLDKITINTGEIQTQIRQIQNNIQGLRSDTRLDLLTKKLKKNTRRTNFVIWLGVASFILLLFTSYALLVKYLPQLDYLKTLTE